MYISKEKKELIKAIIKLNRDKRNLNSKILRVIKDEIENLINNGFAITDIQTILKLELHRDFDYRALAAWIQRNIKKEKVTSKSNQKKENKNKVAKQKDDKIQEKEEIDLDVLREQTKNIWKK
ncbi:hypothetical protein [Nitratiruptor sp. SB155-2]|uniref:hypothetical protein n=1 Tax=Nitratiruptor sp. (strain SB155-2) TaxID=387092 RepID=UPI0001586FA2|nr:hypothetical protein [Nitratiruptor sp. SB155-2]BAF70791.1 hypothetical protein NIS_1685 [Nitratiruptor sp. SB155-2]